VRHGGFSAASIATTTAAEKELAWLRTGAPDITVDRLTGLLRHLKPDGLAGLPLAHGCPINCVTMRSNILDPQAKDVASSKLAIDGYIEHCQVKCSPRNLQLGADDRTCFGRRGSFAPINLPLFHGRRRAAPSKSKSTCGDQASW
jgi:hypothetical protein